MAKDPKEHVSRTYVVENEWKCGTCGEVNKGRDLKCTKCGAPKGKAEKDDVNIDAAQAVQDEKLLKMANAGANWVCGYCGAQDRATDGTCKRCGAGDLKETIKVDADKPAAAPPPAEGLSTNAKIAIGASVALLLLLVLAWKLLASHEATAKVTGIHWEYESTLMEQHVVHDSGEHPPSDAFNKSCEDRTKTVQEDCHPHDCNCKKSKVDKGNGFSEVKETCSTCYDKCDKQETTQFCRYDVHKWESIDRRSERGDDHEPRWPTLEARGGEQRVDRAEHYTVSLKAEKELTYSPSTLQDFKRFDKGASWKIKVNMLGMVTPVAQQ
jgi:hypothetical protein